MSGCQWLCLSKPPRRVFIDSQGRWVNSPPSPTHMLQPFWLIRPEVDLFWELSGAFKLHVMWTTAGGLSGVALIGAEPGRCGASQECLDCVRNVGVTAEVVSAFWQLFALLTPGTKWSSPTEQCRFLPLILLNFSFQLQSTTFLNPILSCCQSNGGFYTVTYSPRQCLLWHTHDDITSLVFHYSLTSGADFQLILSNDYLANWNWLNFVDTCQIIVPTGSLSVVFQ